MNVPAPSVPASSMNTRKRRRSPCLHAVDVGVAVKFEAAEGGIVVPSSVVRAVLTICVIVPAAPSMTSITQLIAPLSVIFVSAAQRLRVMVPEIVTSADSGAVIHATLVGDSLTSIPGVVPEAVDHESLT